MLKNRTFGQGIVLQFLQIKNSGCSILLLQNSVASSVFIKRHYSDQSQEHAEPKQSGKWKKILLAGTLVGFVGTGCYVYLNNDVRKQLQPYIPFDFSSQTISSPGSFIPFLSQDATPLQSNTPTILPPSATSQALPQKTTPTRDSARIVTQAPQSTLSKLKKDDLLAPLVNFSKSVESDVASAVSAQIELETLSKRYISALRTALEAEDGGGNWASVGEAKKAKESQQITANNLLDKAKLSLDQLGKKLDDKGIKTTSDNSVYRDVSNSYKNIQFNLSSVITAAEKAASEAKVLDDYKEIVDRERARLQQEVQDLLPIGTQSADAAALSCEDLNILVAHAHSLIVALRKQLAEYESLERDRLQQLLKSQEVSHDKVTEFRVEQELNKQSLENRETLGKEISSLRSEWERDLHRQLTRQAAAHTDHVQQITRVLREQLGKQFELKLRDSLLRERSQFEEVLHGWTGRVRGVESAVEGRAKMLSTSQRAQQLWLACHSLRTSVEKGSDSLRKQVQAVQQAAKGLDQDQFVLTVLDSLTTRSINTGVSSQDELRNRLHRVRRVCSRVALIPETGASLWQHIVSYLQSILVSWKGVHVVSPDEELPIDGLDTYSLLRSAEAAMAHGDLETAIRFINNMKGMPRLLAHDWILAARWHLEVSQAARTLCTMAAAQGLDAATQYRLPLTDIQGNDSSNGNQSGQPGWM